MVSSEAPVGKGPPSEIQLERAYKLLNRSYESFYEKKYERAVELCGEALGHLLPHGGSSPSSPEEKSDRFLDTYSAVLPVLEAEKVAGVFSFFQSRKMRFGFRRGAPLPNRDWWQFIRVRREEAEEVLQATRAALNSLQERASQKGEDRGAGGS